MRTVTASLVTSLDGVVDAPHEWRYPYGDEAMRHILRETIRPAGAILLGRATYEEWAAFRLRQPSDGGIADLLDGTPKLVASKTLKRVDWPNTALLDGDVIEAVRRLKRGTGAQIWIAGSGTLVRSLLQAGLVDELRLLLHPIVAGRASTCSKTGASAGSSSSSPWKRVRPASST